jgi:hypothetical protein
MSFDRFFNSTSISRSTDSFRRPYRGSVGQQLLRSLRRFAKKTGFPSASLTGPKTENWSSVRPAGAYTDLGNQRSQLLTLGMFQSSPEGRYYSINPAMAELLGYLSPAELLSSITHIAKQTYASSDDRRWLNTLLGITVRQVQRLMAGLR